MVTYLKAQPRIEKRPTVRKAICPTCGKEEHLTFVGVQRWPRMLAIKTGMPELVRLWNCPGCASTVSEIDMLFDPEPR